MAESSHPATASKHGRRETPQQAKSRLQAHRNTQRSQRQQQRRLDERERVAGEIRTPVEWSLNRTERARDLGPAHARPVSARTLVPERRFSGRVILLVIASLVVISFMIPTARSFFQQSAEVAALEEAVAEAEAEQDQLRSDAARWEDPDFIRQQARERINLVLPGESRYHISGLEEVDGQESAQQSEDLDPGENPQNWNEQLLDSVQESAQ